MRNRVQFRVPGHTLVAGGWAHYIDRSGKLVPCASPSGEGRALCVCGAYSPVLPSQHKRGKWMREDHKPQVLEGQEART